MKNLLPIFFLLITTSCSDPELTTSDKLVEKDNISYFGNSEIPYTGEVVNYHPNQSLKMNGKFVDGKKEGKWNTFYSHSKEEEPVKKYEEFYINGEKNGKFIHYEEDGTTVISITEWKDGIFKESLRLGPCRDGSGRSGCINGKTYHKNNKIYNIEYPNYEFVDKNYKGEIYCKITDKQTKIITQHDNEQYTDGKRYHDDGLSFETWKDCELNGETERYWGGFLGMKGTYKDHRKTGKWTWWDPNTDDISSIENYELGVFHGLVQTFYKDSLLVNQKKYDYGFLIEEKKFDRGGNIYFEETHTKDKKSKSIEYKTLFETPSEKRNHLYDFYHVMGSLSGYWVYVDRTCDSDILKKTNYNFMDCLTDINTIKEPNLDPIKITTTFNHDVRHGLFEISDPEDGHVYTTINYFRGGKLGEYKIYNKEGMVIYSVNCLKGGSDYEYYYTTENDTFSGNCRKDGEEIKYRRSPFTKEKKWYLYSKKIFKNDKVVSSEYYRDPFWNEKQIYEGKIIVPYDKNEYMFISLGKYGNDFITRKETK